jgi:putative inorganic carbon (HCO3(-)) transporter
MTDTQRRLLLCAYSGALASAAAGAWLASVSPLIPWVVLAGLALAYLVVARPDIFVLALIAILPWQGALKFPTEQLTIVKLVGGLLFVSVALLTLVKDRRLRLTPVIGWAVLLCTAITLSLIANGLSSATVTETLRFWTLTLFVFLIVQLIDSREAFLRAIRVLAVSAIVGAAWATVQFLDGSVARASGPINDPNDFAYFLAAVLPFVVYLFMVERRRRLLWGAGLACLALGIVGSSSRGAFVALGVTALWAIFTGRLSSKVVLSALATVALLALLALGVSSARTCQNSLSTNVSLREIYWSAALRISAEHPLFGVGPGRFEAVSPDYVRNTPKLEREVAVNNSYLTMLSEYGGIATLVFLGFLAAIWRQILVATGRRGPGGGRLEPGGGRRAPETWLRSAFLASLIVAVVGGIFFSAELSTPIWLIAALASALTAIGPKPLPATEAYAPPGAPS